MKKITKKIQEKKISLEEEEMVISSISDLFSRDLIEIYKTQKLSVFKDIAKQMGLDDQQIEYTIKDFKKLKEPVELSIKNRKVGEIKKIEDRPKFKELFKQINEMSKKDLKKFLIKHSEEFLDEQLLCFYIKYLLFEFDIVFNKQIKRTRFRPDIYVPELKLIIEFDGPTHYTNNTIVIADENRDDTFDYLGYSVVRIPNFIQFKREEMMYLFADHQPIVSALIAADDKIFTKFPNGFWSKKVILPVSFSYRGMIKYYQEIDSFSKNITGFYDDFWKCFEYKIKEYSSVRKVCIYIEPMEINKIKEFMKNVKDEETLMDYEIFLMEEESSRPDKT